MILVLSRSMDLTTNEVIEWIIRLGGSVKRVNSDIIYKDFHFSLNSKQTLLPDSENIKSIWCRRWSPNNDIVNFLENFKSNNQKNLSFFLQKEIGHLNKYILDLYKKANWLSHPSRGNLNKLTVLELAKKYKLNIPYTVVTTNKSELLKMLNNFNQIITKPIFNPPQFNTKNSFYTSKTVLLDNNNIEKIKMSFFPSLFQEYINKEYEIRSFFLDGKFYSMAIFSQLDESTKVDFRNYNISNPNRTIPYFLPNKIKQKLTCLFNELNLKTGSVDLMYFNGDYYFLEINPVGQFGMTSHPCNYNLEKEIAKYLIKHDI